MIELPNWAVPNGAEPYYIDAGGVLQGYTADQRINRPGSKFGLPGSFPPMRASDKGRILLNLMIRAKSEGLRIEIPLLGFKPGSPGNPVVSGNGQAGRSLTVRGFTPHYAVRQGQWFTHMRGDEGLLYNVDEAGVADAAGNLTISFSPMLRVEPVDGDVLNFASPTIEGLIHGDEYAWRMSLAHHLELEFHIRERR